MSYNGVILSGETADFTIFCNNDITGSEDITFCDDITISDDHTICDDITLSDVAGDQDDLINMDLHLECTDDSQYVMPEMVRQTAHSILGQNVHLKISFPKEPDLDPSKRYTCPDSECSRTFSKDHFLKQHLITKHGKNVLFNCRQCTFETNSNRNLLRHTKRVHSRSQQTNPHKNYEFVQFATEFDKTISDNCYLEQNLSSKLLSVHCTLCNFKTNSNRNLSRHVKRVHGKQNDLIVDDVMEDQSLLYVCSECTRRFANNQQLMEHLVSKHGHVFSVVDSPQLKSNVQQIVPENTDLVNQEISPVVDRGFQQIDIPDDRCVESINLKYSFFPNFFDKKRSLESMDLTTIDPTHSSMVSTDNAGKRDLLGYSPWTETPLSLNTSSYSSPIPLKLFRVLPAVEGLNSGSSESLSLCHETSFRKGASLVNLSENNNEIETVEEIETDYSKTAQSAPDKTTECHMYYKCTVCNFMCLGLEPPRNHSHKVLPFCTSCSRSFSKESIFQNHHCQLHTKDKQNNLNSCPRLNCDFKYRKASDSDQHEQADHKHNRFSKCNLQLPNEKKNQPPITCNPGKPFVCSWNGCGKSFRDGFNLKTHFKTHTGAKTKFCNFCDFNCIQKTSMDWHIKKKHSRMTKSQRKHATTEFKKDGNGAANVKTLHVQIEITDVGRNREKNVMSCLL